MRGKWPPQATGGGTSYGDYTQRTYTYTYTPAGNIDTWSGMAFAYDPNHKHAVTHIARP